MRRRKFITDVSTFTLFTFLMNGMRSCTGARTPQKLIIPEGAGYQMEYIRGNVGFFTEQGGTIGWMMRPEGAVVIDTQFPAQAQNLIDQMQASGTERITHLINTHHHGDHTSGNIAFADHTDSIVAHENSLKNQKHAAKSTGKEADQLYPNETFQDQKQLKVGGETIELKYFGPAHTDGDIVIHFQEANVAHIGDLVFNRKFPYIDKAHGADIGHWVQVLDDILKEYDDDTVFIWGHALEGHPIKGGKDPIRAFRVYLENLLVIGEQAYRQGLTKEAFLSKYTQIPNAPEWQGEGIERSLNAVWQEFK